MGEGRGRRARQSLELVPLNQLARTLFSVEVLGFASIVTLRMYFVCLGF